MKILLELYTTWFKIGMFTFGGGYAMLPLVEEEIVKKKKWASYEEIMDYYAIGQATPGIIAVNTATFTGYFQKGIIGGIVSTLGVVSPSFIIIAIVSTFINEYQSLTIVQNALKGINIAVCVLMYVAIKKLVKNNIKGKVSLVVLFLIFIGSYFMNISTIVLVVISGIFGLIYRGNKI